MRTLTRLSSVSMAVLWGLMLLLLPITSMPAVRDLLHISVIAMPSIFALGLLLIFWLIPYFLRGGGYPRTALPLLGFVFAVMLSLALSGLQVVPTIKGSGFLRQEISAFITLLVGLAFFLTAYSKISKESELKTALMWIYLGGAIMILWSFAQSAAWMSFGRYPDWMRDLQDMFSLGPLYRQRATGFALEPSWLAHMLNMLYLPVWLASVVSGYSAFRFRLFKKITLEMVLLAGGILVLILTLSRVGWITFFCMIAYLVIGWNVHLVRWLQSRFRIKEENRRGSTVLLSIGLVLLYLGVIVFAAFGMSRVDPRMADLFTPGFWKLNDLNRYANALQFGERVVYWQAGWDVFNRFPVVGVGLGNAGRWFDETIPSYGLNLIEVRQLLYRSTELPNIKNLWIRILAETGFVGFAFFIAWLGSLLKQVIGNRNSRNTLQKFAAIWCIFIVIGIVLEGFSIDSFGMPYFWISSGLILSIDHIQSTEGQGTLVPSREES